MAQQAPHLPDGLSEEVGIPDDVAQRLKSVGIRWARRVGREQEDTSGLRAGTSLPDEFAEMADMVIQSHGVVFFVPRRLGASCEMLVGQHGQGAAEAQLDAVSRRPPPRVDAALDPGLVSPSELLAALLGRANAALVPPGWRRSATVGQRALQCASARTGEDGDTGSIEAPPGESFQGAPVGVPIDAKAAGALGDESFVAVGLDGSRRWYLWTCGADQEAPTARPLPDFDKHAALFGLGALGYRDRDVIQPVMVTGDVGGLSFTPLVPDTRTRRVLMDYQGSRDAHFVVDTVTRTVYCNYGSTIRALKPSLSLEELNRIATETRHQRFDVLTGDHSRWVAAVNIPNVGVYGEAGQRLVAARDGTLLMTTNSDGMCAVCDRKGAKAVCFPPTVVCAAIAPRARVVTVDRDGTILAHDAADGSKRPVDITDRFPSLGPNARNSTLALSADGGSLFLLVLADDRRAVHWAAMPTSQLA